MEGRGDSFPKVLERIINDVSDFKDAEKYADYIVYNDDDTKFCNLVEQVWEYIRTNRD